MQNKLPLVYSPESRPRWPDRRCVFDLLPQPETDAELILRCNARLQMLVDLLQARNRATTPPTA